jgi:hypothetical protein
LGVDGAAAVFLFLCAAVFFTPPLARLTSKPAKSAKAKLSTSMRTALSNFASEL